MPKAPKTPSTVLIDLIAEYQINPFALSKAISLSQSAVRQIVIGKARISVPIALRLAKFFGQTATYWLDLQRDVDLKEAADDKELTRILTGISKVKKPAAKPKTKGKSKVPSKLLRKPTLADKRKKGVTR